MKNKMKWLMFALLLVTGAGLHAQTIDLHLACKPEAKDCAEFKDDKGTAYTVTKDPSFRFSEKNVADVWEAIGEFGEVQLRMDLKPEAAGQFSDLTGAHIGQVLHIVHEGRVITAPLIRDQISGSLTLSQGAENDRAWQKIPWIKERVNRTEARERVAKKERIAIYVTLATILLFGGLAYAFRRRRSERE